MEYTPHEEEFPRKQERPDSVESRFTSALAPPPKLSYDLLVLSLAPTPMSLFA